MWSGLPTSLAPDPGQNLILTKVEATGNDFLLVDGDLTGGDGTFDRPLWVKRWCDRRRGIGGDGAIFLKSFASDYAWDFYNADGTAANMCGNAARAVGLYLFLKTTCAQFRIQTNLGLIAVEVHDPDHVTVEFSRPQILDQSGLDFALIDTGVPHAVIDVVSIADLNALRPMALHVRARPQFTTSGINVTFRQRVSRSEICAVTFERGVNDFTLSCGTGAIAAVRSLGETLSETVLVNMPGGRLTVSGALKPKLTGAARIVGHFWPLSGA